MKTAAAAIVRKDLLMFFSDRRAVIMSFVAPVAIASFFGFIFSGGEDREASRVPIRVIDDDRSAISAAIARGLAEDKSLAVAGGTVGEAREAVRKGKTAVAIVVPRGFGDAAGQAFFGGGERPRVDLLYDPSHATELAMVRGILTQHVMQAVSAEMFGGDQGRRLTQRALEQVQAPGVPPDPDRQALADMLSSVNRWYERTPGSPAPGASAAPARGLSMPYDVREQAVTAQAGVAYNGFAHAFAGMGVQFLLSACIDLAIGMLTERQLGLWKRLRAAPISRLVLLGAKAASGAWVPSFVFPAWLQKVTLVIPARWAVDGLDAATWRGVDFMGILPAVGVLLAFAALFGALAVARFRWDEA
jgi:ABC-2 type transport system permease protein